MLVYGTSGKRGVGWVSPSAKREPVPHVRTTTPVVGPMARPVGHPNEHDGGLTHRRFRRCGVPRVDSPNG
jgi:hypothetical protein